MGLSMASSMGMSNRVSMNLFSAYFLILNSFEKLDNNFNQYYIFITFFIGQQ